MARKVQVTGVERAVLLAAGRSTESVGAYRKGIGEVEWSLVMLGWIVLVNDAPLSLDGEALYRAHLTPVGERVRAGL